MPERNRTRRRQRLLYTMIFITAGIVLVIEPLSHVLGFGHGHDGHAHPTGATGTTLTPHPHDPDGDPDRGH